MATMYHVKSGRERAATKGARFDLAEERVLADWIEEITEETRFDQSLFEWLQNGQVLCHLVNKIRPNSVKVNRQLAMKVKRENIQNFLLFCVTLGIKEEDMFDPEDLLDMINTAKVVHGLYRFSSLIARIAPQYAGPSLQLPGIFALYYRGHFKEEAGLGDIHKRFAAFRARAPGMGVPEVGESSKEGAAPPSIFLPSMGSFGGAVGKFGGVLLAASQDTGNKSALGATVAIDMGGSFLPSMGSFGGPVGRFGGIHSPRSAAAKQPQNDTGKRHALGITLPPDSGNSFLPSMGSFGGPVGKFGGIHSPRSPAAKQPQNDTDKRRALGITLPPDWGNSFLPSMGSFGGPVGKFGGIHSPSSAATKASQNDMDERPVLGATLPQDSGNSFLPSMGSFGGPVGKFGGIHSPRSPATQASQNGTDRPALGATLPQDSGSSFLPSMGSFAGPVGKFGGMHSPRK